MNSAPDPELDELASAYLDGEATPDEVARVEASAELLERAERLRLVAAQVAATVPPPAIDQRESAVAAAVEASATAQNVTSMATHRPRSARTMRIASVAAVVALIMLAVPLLVIANDSDGGNETVASEVATDTADAGLGEVESLDLEASAAEAGSAEAPAEDPAEETAATAPEPAADESAGVDTPGDADESLADDVAGEGSPGESRFAEQLRSILIAPRVSFDRATDIDEIAIVLFSTVDGGITVEEVEEDIAPDDVPECIPEWLADIDGVVLAFTVTELGDRPVVGVAIEAKTGTRVVLILDASDCETVAAIDE